MWLRSPITPRVDWTQKVTQPQIETLTLAEGDGSRIYREPIELRSDLSIWLECGWVDATEDDFSRSSHPIIVVINSEEDSPHSTLLPVPDPSAEMQPQRLIRNVVNVGR